MTTVNYVWRSLTLDDTAAWSALTAAISAADGTGEQFSADDLAEELDDPSIDPARDTVAVWTDDGSLVAYGQVIKPAERADGAIRAAFDGGVHPEHRGRGIGAELLGRLERRSTEWSGELFPERPVHPMTASEAPGSTALFEAHGYRPVRFFHTMKHDLADDPEPPDDRLRAFDPTLDEQVREAHIDAFARHWNFAPPDVEQWRHWYTGSRTFRPDCSAIGATPDGLVDAYLLAYEYEPGELWFGQIGVRQRARARGLGRGVLRYGLAAAAREGYTVVKLDVDSDNADGAGALYESVGFVEERTKVVYQR